MKKNSWLLDVLNRRCLKKVNNKYRSHWCKRKKKSWQNLEQATHAAAQPKNKTIFSPKCSLFVAYILRLRPPFSRQVSTCLMLYWCPAIGNTTTKILWWIFFFFKSRKKMLPKYKQNKNSSLKKTWGLLLTTWTINFFVWLKKTR